MKNRFMLVNLLALVVMASSTTLFCMEDYYDGCCGDDVEVMEVCPYCGDPSCDGSCMETED